jgi:fluoroquinolone transport system permease protein
MRIYRLLRMDIAFQFRHGFYYAYLFVTAIFSLIIIFLPSSLKQLVAVFFILTDTSVLGFFFVGGVLLLEKKQALLHNPAVTPLRLSEYIFSKVISFLLLSMASSLIIQTTTLQLPRNTGLFLYTLTLSGILYTLFGVVLGTLAKSLNHYFALSFCFVVLIIPTASYFLEWTPYEIFTTFPFTAIFLLLKAGVYGTSVGPWSILGLVLWNLLFYAFAYLALYKVIYTRISFLFGLRQNLNKGVQP